MAAIPLLLTAIVGFSAWYYVRYRYVLQLGVYFNFCALAYMVFGLAAASMMMAPYYRSELEQIGWMSVPAVIGFNIAYLVAKSGSAASSGCVHGYMPSYKTVFTVASVGFVFEVVAMLIIGPLDFLFIDRKERFNLFNTWQVLFYFANLINVCLPVVLMRYLRFGQRRDLRLFVFLLTHGILYGLLTISRFHMVILLLVVCYLLERYQRLRPSTIICILIISFASTVIFKPLFYQIILAKEYHVTFDFGEYTNWVRNTILMLGIPEVEMPHNGYSLALKSLFIISPETDSLSEWFYKEFYPERKILFPGLGYGFSGLYEGYAANGWMGTMMHFAFFGALFGLLERSPTAMRHIFIIFAMLLTYRLFRSEVYNFVKTYAWYFSYPMFAIVIADKLLVSASGWRQKATPGGPPIAR